MEVTEDRGEVNKDNPEENDTIDPRRNNEDAKYKSKQQKKRIDWFLMVNFVSWILKDEIGFKFSRKPSLVLLESILLHSFYLPFLIFKI